jgi:hypothetical protein
MRKIEECYFTKDGKVFHKGKEVKQWVNSNGYPMFWADKRNNYTHIQIALQYLEKTEEQTQVNHKDGNKTNNDLSNLEWVTPSGNRQHAIETKLWGKNIIEKRRFTTEQVEEIKKLYPKMGYLRISKVYKCAKSTIRNIIKDKSYQKIDEQWLVTAKVKNN